MYAVKVTTVISPCTYYGACTEVEKTTMGNPNMEWLLMSSCMDGLGKVCTMQACQLIANMRSHMRAHICQSYRIFFHIFRAPELAKNID